MERWRYLSIKVGMDPLYCTPPSPSHSRACPASSIFARPIPPLQSNFKLLLPFNPNHSWSAGLVPHLTQHKFETTVMSKAGDRDETFRFPSRHLYLFISNCNINNGNARYLPCSPVLYPNPFARLWTIQPRLSRHIWLTIKRNFYTFDKAAFEQSKPYCSGRLGPHAPGIMRP